MQSNLSHFYTLPTLTDLKGSVCRIIARLETNAKVQENVTQNDPQKSSWNYTLDKEEIRHIPINYSLQNAELSYCKW